MAAATSYIPIEQYLRSEYEPDLVSSHHPWTVSRPLNPFIRGHYLALAAQVG